MVISWRAFPCDGAFVVEHGYSHDRLLRIEQRLCARARLEFGVHAALVVGDAMIRFDDLQAHLAGPDDSAMPPPPHHCFLACCGGSCHSHVSTK
jgi:hypothetical protein